MSRRGRVLGIVLVSSLELVTLRAAAAPDPPSTTQRRLPLEILGGAIGVFVAVGVGVSALQGGGERCGDEVEPGAPDSYCSYDGDSFASAGVLFGTSLVVVPPALVTLGGHAAGGDGSFGYALLGSFAGLIGGVLVAVPTALATDSVHAFWFVPAGIVTGSILGYELSATRAGAAPRSPPSSRTGTRVTLLANPAQRWIGVAGSF